MKKIVGRVAISKKGHDKGSYYIIIKEEFNYVYLVDGKTRLMIKPKKKLLRHVQMSNYVICEIDMKIENNIEIFDFEVYEALKKYKNTIQGGK